VKTLFTIPLQVVVIMIVLNLLELESLAAILQRPDFPWDSRCPLALCKSSLCLKFTQ